MIVDLNEREARAGGQYSFDIRDDEADNNGEWKRYEIR